MNQNGFPELSKALKFQVKKLKEALSKMHMNAELFNDDLFRRRKLSGHHKVVATAAKLNYSKLCTTNHFTYNQPV